MQRPFWQTTPLNEMTDAEWESLCDGCGRCCLVKLQDDETNEVFTTNIACRLLDIDSCRCRDYENRTQTVATCMVLAADKKDLLTLLPDSCAYRRLDMGRDLPGWHPLLSADPDSVHRAGASVREYAQSEEYIHPDQIADHVIDK